jgi:hypothetical protein
MDNLVHIILPKGSHKNTKTTAQSGGNAMFFAIYGNYSPGA